MEIPNNNILVAGLVALIFVLLFLYCKLIDSIITFFLRSNIMKMMKGFFLFAVLAVGTGGCASFDVTGLDFVSSEGTLSLRNVTDCVLLVDRADRASSQLLKPGQRKDFRGFAMNRWSPIRVFPQDFSKCPYQPLTGEFYPHQQRPNSLRGIMQDPARSDRLIWH